MAEVGQAEPLRAGLAREVVLGWERRVQQGVQGGVVKVVVCGKSQISQALTQEVNKSLKIKFNNASRITHFYDFLPHWPHLAPRSAFQGCLTDVVAAVVVAVAVHQRQHQRQCHAPETERFKNPNVHLYPAFLVESLITCCT